MDQDHPEERFADPEEVRAEREMHLLLLEAAMYAQMARTNALVAAAAQIDAAVESLLDDLGGERTEDLRRREAELARRQAALPPSSRLRLPSPSQTLIREAQRQALELQRQFEAALDRLRRGDDDLELEAGVYPPLGLGRGEYLFRLARKHFGEDASITHD